LRHGSGDAGDFLHATSERESAQMRVSPAKCGRLDRYDVTVLSAKRFGWGTKKNALFLAKLIIALSRIARKLLWGRLGAWGRWARQSQTARVAEYPYPFFCTFFHWIETHVKNRCETCRSNLTH